MQETTDLKIKKKLHRITFLDINRLKTSENVQGTQNLLNITFKNVLKKKVMNYEDVDEEKKIHQLSGRKGEKKFDLKSLFR